MLVIRDKKDMYSKKGVYIYVKKILSIYVAIKKGQRKIKHEEMI